MNIEALLDKSSYMYAIAFPSADFDLIDLTSCDLYDFVVTELRQLLRLCSFGGAGASEQPPLSKLPILRAKLCQGFSVLSKQPTGSQVEVGFSPDFDISDFGCCLSLITWLLPVAELVVKC